MAEDRATVQQAWHELDAARLWLYEDPGAAEATADRSLALAERLDDDALAARAIALKGVVTLNRGALRAAYALASRAALHADGTDDDTAHVETAALEAQLSFFTGSYNDALRAAERMIARADATGRPDLKLYARRAGCVVFGNLAVPEWPTRLQQQVDLALTLGNRWDEAISRNDLAHMRMLNGDHAAADAEIERALAIAAQLAPHNRLALAVLHCTRSELRLRSGRAQDALADAEHATALLGAQGRDAHAYLLGMTVVSEVQALLAAGRADDAWRRGREAVERLGDGLPQIRSLILRDVAEAMRTAGRHEDAYTALAESAELERIAFRELTELQRDLDRAMLEASAARHEASALADANAELEALQAQLREQADRDWLTGLHNRRYLARAMDDLSPETAPGPCSLAILDLDHFKSINDRFGHQVGDEVLVRVAILLRREVRTADVVARTGGEEFVIVMPGSEPHAAAACAERLRVAVAAEPWHEVHPDLEVTASIGVASGSSAAGVGTLATVADERLYAAKDAGRNRVEAA
jgi:diguanylate cyclase (GGDEF)-like protein